MQITAMEPNYASPSVGVERQLENTLLSTDSSKITPCAVITVVVCAAFFRGTGRLHSIESRSGFHRSKHRHQVWIELGLPAVGGASPSSLFLIHPPTKIHQSRSIEDQGFLVVKKRTAFTLLELLLTLAVLAALTAVAIPQIGLLAGDRRLVRGGDLLRVEITRLRVDAMRQGRVLMLEGMLQGNSFRSKPFYSASDATEAYDQTGSQSGLLTGAAEGVVAMVEQDSDAEELIELPEDIMVENVGVVSAARAMEIEQVTDSARTDEWSRPILFYPDGSTSTAVVTLYNPELGRVVVRVRGITGDVTVSEVLSL